MKKIFIAALAALALVSCQQEQSELNFSDIQGSATIKGKVLYEVGKVVEDNIYLEKTLPAAGIEVVAEVDYSQYDREATGVKKFVAKTTETGEYEIQIPVGQKAISVSITPRGFTADYNNEVNGDILTSSAYYKGNTLSNQTISYDEVLIASDIIMYANPDAIETRNVQVTLVGNILGQVEQSIEETPYGYDSQYNQYTGQYEYIPLYTYTGEVYVRGTEGIACNMTITLSNNGKEIVYNNIKSKADGTYKLTVNLYDVWDLSQTQVSVKTDAFVVPDFKHYYCTITPKAWKSQLIEGIYSSSTGGRALNSEALLTDVKIGDIILPFRPIETSHIIGIGNSDIDKDKDGNDLYIANNPFNWYY